MRRELFRSDQKFIISGKILNRVIEICKQFAHNNPQYDKSVMALLRILLMLEEIDEIVELDRSILEEQLKNNILDIIMYDLIEEESDEDKSMSLDQMLRNVGLKLSRRK